MNANQRIKFVKIAFNAIELNNSAIAGKVLAEALKFLCRRIPFDKRPFIMEKLKHKIIHLNQSAMAQKEIPTTAILGQCIAFTKNILNGNDPAFIKNVLLHISKNL